MTKLLSSHALGRREGNKPAPEGRKSLPRPTAAIGKEQNAPTTEPRKPESQPELRFRSSSGPVEVKDPNAQATDKQFQYIKRIHGANPENAREILGALFNRAILDMSPVLIKGEASQIISKIIAAGLRPSRRK